MGPINCKETPEMGYSTAIHTRDEAWVWIRDIPKNHRLILRSFPYERIPWNLIYFVWNKNKSEAFFGGWESNHFGKSFPWFQTPLPKPFQTHPEVAPLNSHPPKDCKLQSLGPGDGKVTHVGAFRISEDETRDTPFLQKKLCNMTMEKESWMKMSISPIKNGDVLASHVNFQQCGIHPFVTSLGDVAMPSVGGESWHRVSWNWGETHLKCHEKI